MMAFLKRLAVGEEGATTVEYAMLIAILAAGAVSAITSVKTGINTKFTTVSNVIAGS